MIFHFIQHGVPPDLHRYFACEFGLFVAHELVLNDVDYVDIITGSLVEEVRVSESLTQLISMLRIEITCLNKSVSTPSAFLFTTSPAIP